MRDSSLSPSSRLGGAVISDRIVSALLEELRTGRYAQTDRLPAEFGGKVYLGGQTVSLCIAACAQYL